MTRSTSTSGVTRRHFLSTSAIALVGAPAIHGSNKSGSSSIVGDGDYKFRVHHAWPQLPQRFSWQTTHNVAVDAAGFLYVIHEGRTALKDHPSIFVFDPQGRYVRSFGKQFQGGGHGIEVRKEGNEQFLYVCAYQHLKTFAKLNLKGETVWQKRAPMQSGVYAAGEAKNPKKIWGRNRFLPTNFAFIPGGDFFLVDGYGSYFIHRYNKDGQWKHCFGGPGKGQGKFNLPHGIWIDSRNGQSPTVTICDRANNTVQWLTMDGKHLRTQSGYGLPANADTWKGLMVVPELVARVTLLGPDNRVVARLGTDVHRVSADKKRAIRSNEKLWQDGKFVHPHDACFDPDGNIFVAEWVGSGRVTKLERLG